MTGGVIGDFDEVEADGSEFRREWEKVDIHSTSGRFAGKENRNTATAGGGGRINNCFQGRRNNFMLVF